MMATKEKISAIKEILKLTKKSKNTAAFDKLNDKSEEYLKKLLEVVNILP
jgi:hypothetical protein